MRQTAEDYKRDANALSAHEQLNEDVTAIAEHLVALTAALAEMTATMKRVAAAQERANRSPLVGKPLGDKFGDGREGGH